MFDEVGDLTIIKAEPNHAWLFTPISIHSERDRLAACQQIEDGAVAYTMIAPDKEIVGIIGAVFMHEKVMTYWALLSDLIRKYPVGTHKAMLKYIDLVMEKYNLDRVQTFIDSRNLTAIRHNEKLGLVKEGLLVKFGRDGANQYVFAKVRA